MIFEKKVEIQNDKILITVSCNQQTYSSEERHVFREKVEDLIPEEFKTKVVLVSSPSKLISNIKRNKYTNVGTWEFKINHPKKRAAKSTNTKRTTRTVKKVSTDETKSE
jgi:hypothetical protein